MRPTRLAVHRPFLASGGLGYSIVAATSSNTLALGGVAVGSNAIGSNYHFVSASSNVGYWIPHDSSGSEVPIDHGNMGTTETINIGEGTWHRGTLNTACAITVTGFTVDVGIVALLEFADTGAITWDADVDFGGGDDQPDASGYTAFLLWSSEGNSTIYGAKVGAAGSAGFGTTPQIQSVGSNNYAGLLSTVSRADHIHDANPTLLGLMGVTGEILISDTPSTPLVFADLIQNDDQNDLLYADLVDL